MRNNVLLWLLATMLIFSSTAVAANPSSPSVKRHDVRIASLYSPSYGANYGLLSWDWGIKSNYRLGVTVGARGFEEVTQVGGYFGYELPQDPNRIYTLYSNLGLGYWIEQGINAPYFRLECGLRFKVFDPVYLGVGLDEYILLRDGSKRLHNVAISLGVKF